MKIPDRIWTSVFYLINAIGVLFFLYSLTCSTHTAVKLFGILIDIVWIYSFSTHIYNFKELYVEKEAFDNLANQYLKIVKENKSLKEKLKEEKI